MVLDPRDGGVPVAKFSWPPHPGIPFDSCKFGQCYVRGSGREDFINLIRSSEGLTLRGDRETNACENAVFVALSLAAHFSGNQTRLGSGLSNLYGGGFEIATVFDNEIRKVTGVTYYLLNAEQRANGDLTLTFHSTIKYDYHGDTLLVRLLEPVEPPNPSSDDLFVISPVHKTPSEPEKNKLMAELEVPSFDSQFSVFYVHVPQAAPEGRTLYLMHYRGEGGETPVHFIERADSLGMELSPRMSERIIAAVQKALATP
jgi:hypothetical protein